MSTFDEESFRQRVDSSLKLVSSILEKNRNPLYPSEVSHKYDDKYLLVQSLYAVLVHPIRSHLTELTLLWSRK
jgi:hypothetical protein